jgi:prepilin-type processing-associated H-X9-DG protein
MGKMSIMSPFRRTFMTTIFSALMLLILAQAPARPAGDSSVQAIAPFVETDVFAILQIDLARTDLQGLAARVMGDSPSGVIADVKRNLQWSDSLRKAGAKEVYFLMSVIDISGPPLVVVPLVGGTDAAQISRLFKGDGTGPSLFGLHACATLHNAVVAGSPAALERARLAAAAPRPELFAAFAAAGGEVVAARLLILPSADSRRVLEEMVPAFPPELGGGPMTDLTHGIIWAALALETERQPSLRLIAESKDASAAKSLQQLAHHVIEYLSRMPDLRKLVPELPKILADVEPSVDGQRITINVDAKKATALIDAIARPARQSAIRSQCMNNEKQIGLAIHNYIARHQSFPPAYTADKAGKPLLSWRVLILPYLEQDALYKEFHLDEAWDSPHNQALIAKMPATYRCPAEGEELAGEGKTRYLSPRGKATIFAGTETVKLRDVSDGTSNTIMVVEAGDANAVVWTKPDDWNVDPEPNTAGVFSSHVGAGGNGSNFGFADGSVRFFYEKLKPATLRALLSRNGGEVISADDF